jgi:DNA-directed RNA polymerase specialized sigma24 family protein
LWLEDPREIRAAAKALKKLAALDAAHADILEQRLFRGRSAKEIGEILDIPSGSVERLWPMIRAWTLREMAGGVPRSEDAFDPFAPADTARRERPAWPSIDGLL